MIKRPVTSYKTDKHSITYLSDADGLVIGSASTEEEANEIAAALNGPKEGTFECAWQQVKQGKKMQRGDTIIYLAHTGKLVEETWVDGEKRINPRVVFTEFDFDATDWRPAEVV